MTIETEMSLNADGIHSSDGVSAGRLFHADKNNARIQRASSSAIYILIFNKILIKLDQYLIKK